MRGAFDIFRPGSNKFLLYRPLSQIGYFWALQALFAYDSAPYHAVQLLAHVLNAWFVYAVAALVLRSRPLGVAAALIYAAAPGHAIAVYWVALYSMTGTVSWYLLSLWWWLRRRPPAAGSSGLTYWTTTSVALALYLVTLLTGEHGMSLPFALFLASVLILQEPWKAAVVRLSPLLLVAVAYTTAKLWYMRYGLDADFPELFMAAVIRTHYAPVFAPLESLRLLGFYTGCALGWLYDSSPTATRWYGVGVIMFASCLASAWYARTSVTARRVLFGLLLFITALGPVLLLPGHPYSYYVGTAGAGLAIALVAAARAVPRVGAPLVAVLVLFILAGEILVGEPKARENEDFRFVGQFRNGALRWIAAVDEASRRGPEGVEVVIPHSLLSELVFERGRAQQIFLGRTNPVSLSRKIEAETASDRRVVIERPPLWLRGNDYPGLQRRWDWLRGGSS